jgi:hypothetical protein
LVWFASVWFGFDSVRFRSFLSRKTPELSLTMPIMPMMMLVMAMMLLMLIP